MSYTPVELKCPNCSKIFIKVNAQQKFCSKECLVALMKDKSKPGPSKTEKCCQTCGKKFFVINGKRVLANQRFCSGKCSRPAKPKTKKCERCGNDFNYSREVNKYCGTRCRYESYKS